MKRIENDLFPILRISSISILSIVIYIILISIFTFFHFNLNHDMFTINSWITENKWEILFLVKTLVWAIVFYWKKMTQPSQSLMKNMRLLFLGSLDSFLSGIFNIFAIMFFIYFEGVQNINFNFKVFLYLSLFYLSDVVAFLFFKVQEMQKIKLLGLILVLATFNGVYLHLVELFEPALLLCYLLTFAAGSIVMFTKRVHKSMVFSFGVFGLSFFVALTYSSVLSDRYLLELSISKINTLILFFSLAVANYFFINLRAVRLQKLNEV